MNAVELPGLTWDDRFLRSLPVDPDTTDELGVGRSAHSPWREVCLGSAAHEACREHLEQRDLSKRRRVCKPRGGTRGTLCHVEIDAAHLFYP